MIQVAIALLVGFIIGWLIFLHREVAFSAGAAVVLLALLEALTYGWLMWSKQAVEAAPRSLTKPVIAHFLAGCIFGLIVLDRRRSTACRNYPDCHSFPAKLIQGCIEKWEISYFYIDFVACEKYFFYNS